MVGSPLASNHSRLRKGRFVPFPFLLLAIHPSGFVDATLGEGVPEVQRIA